MTNINFSRNNKGSAWFFIIFVIAIGVVLWFVVRPASKSETMEKIDSLPNQEETKMEDGVMTSGEENQDINENAPVAKKGSYESYDSSKLSSANNSKVVLFFNASWCPTCQAVNAELKTSSIPEGLTVLSVDYDSNIELRRKYGITYQHTFIQVDSTGDMITKWSGGGLEKIISSVK